MQTFRAYTLSPTGKITSGQWMEAADLEEARRMARDLCAVEHAVVELWQGAARLARVDCRNEAA